jgi:hypothetical protein
VLVALLLAPLPVLALALVARVVRPLPASERAVVALAACAFAASALLSPIAPIHDQWTHFVHLRLALDEPIRLLDLWDRPGFMLLYAAPAALGLTAARLASAAVGALALAATLRAAASLGLARPWAAGLLLVAQYDFFGQASSTMTELPFAAALAIAIWGWAEDRPWLVAAGAGWCAVTRPEGVLFAAVIAAAIAARHRNVAAAAAALLPFPLWLLAGALAHGDALWWLHGNPYGGLVGPRVEARQLAESYFYEALRQSQPPVLLLLEAAGAALALAGPARRLRFLLAPVALSFLVLTFLRIGETDAWRESRYLVAIAPALALLAAAALDAALAALPRAAPPALLALAAAGAAHQLLWRWREALEGVPWPVARAAAYAALLTAAAVLWAARHRIRPRPALALLLALPLACSPPGAFSRHRPERGAAASQPEVGLPDALVREQLAPAAREHHPAGLEDEPAVGDGEGVRGVLLDEQHRHPAAVDLLHHAEHLLHQDGREP